jgi:hypothetical protein
MAGLTTIWKQDADFLLGGVRWNWPTFEEGWKTKQSRNSKVLEDFALLVRSPFLSVSLA